MKNTIEKVGTWLPVFSGFYGTIWETDNDEESEMSDINEQRAEKGLEPIEWDAIEWDYQGYHQEVSKGFTSYVEHELKRLGFISSMAFEKVVSPSEYNFTNDAVDVSVELSDENKVAILGYIKANLEAFDVYVTETYTSGSGFISSYSNNSTVWLADEETLSHTHGLGAVLNFILLNEN